MSYRKMVYVSNDSTAKDIARKAFPDWRGRKISFSVLDPEKVFDLSNYNGETYAIIDCANDAVERVPYYSPMSGDKRPGIKIRPNVIVVEHSRFEGKECGITIYLHPENVTLLLPKPPELSWAEQVVLTVTAELKASSRRYPNLREASAVNDKGMAIEEYHAAKQVLIGRKLLNRAGAITDAGRNAIGGKEFYQLPHRRELN